MTAKTQHSVLLTLYSTPTHMRIATYTTVNLNLTNHGSEQPRSIIGQEVWEVSGLGSDIVRPLLPFVHNVPHMDTGYHREAGCLK